MGGGQRDYGIPGTTVFDGYLARKGYALNRMCYSFNSAENRAEFRARRGGLLPQVRPQRRAARGDRAAATCCS